MLKAVTVASAQFTPPTSLSFREMHSIHRKMNVVASAHSVKSLKEKRHKNSFPSAIAIEVYCNPL
jgi:hypothetical protein